MAGQSRPRRHRIVCIDDYAPGLSVRSQLLQRWGYTVTTANDGDAGLRVLEDSVADAVVVDYCMPGKNGQVVAETIKARWPGVRVIMLSGDPNVPRGAKASADAFVAKDDTTHQFRSTLARLLTSVPPQQTKLRRKLERRITFSPARRMCGQAESSP